MSFLRYKLNSACHSNGAADAEQPSGTSQIALSRLEAFGPRAEGVETCNPFRFTCWEGLEYPMTREEGATCLKEGLTWRGALTTG